MNDFIATPAYLLGEAVRRGEARAEAAVDAAFTRIGAVDEAVNAFCSLREDAARAEAREIDARVARGEDPGPLAGVPFGVKDEQDVAGMPTTYGSVPMRDHVPARDSTMVARLRAAGAIPIGKTNMPEFGSTAFTKNRLFGVTRNPWNLDRTPGGSSGGSSAAVAAGEVPLATGGDGGGSIRIPASYSGLVGLKPTFGVVSRAPFLFRDWVDTISRGPIVRTVRDAAVFLDVVAGYDPLDPDSVPAPSMSYVSALDAAPDRVRIAYADSLGYGRVARDVRREVEAAVRALERDLGIPIEATRLQLTDAGFAWAMLNCFEQRAKLAPKLEAHRDEWGRGYLVGIDHAAKLTAADIGEHQRTRLRLLEEVAAFFSSWDVLLTPTVPTTAFPAGGPMPADIDGDALTSPIHAVAFSYPFNLTGHPACTVPVGLGDDGLPVGLQVVSERHREHLVLQVAAAIERAHPFTARPTAV